MHISKRQNSIDNNCIVLHSQNTKEFQLNIFLTGTLLQTGTVGFPQRKQLPRSTANSMVRTYEEEDLIYANLKCIHDCTVQRGR